MFLQEKQTSMSKFFDILSNYVDLSTSQTIKAQKTFDGEQKFLNTQYCPTINDTASGIGCAFKASRGLFNEALIDKMVITGSTKKIPFVKYTGTSGGSMTGMTEVASIDENGALSTNGAITVNNKDGLYTLREYNGISYKDQFYNMAYTPGSATTLNRWRNGEYQGGISFGNNSTDWTYFAQILHKDGTTKYDLFGEHNTDKLKSIVKAMIESGEIEVGSNSSGIQVFESNGTFTVPKGISAIYITACAGGGGGGGGGYTSSSGSNGRYRYTGGGGGGGGVIVKKFYSVTPGSSISVTVGTGGAGGNGCGATGGTGGNTVIGSLITLNGGTGGTSINYSAGEGGVGAQGAGGGGGSSRPAGDSAFSPFLIPFYSTSTTSAAGISGIYKGGKGGNSNEGFGGGGSLGAGGDGGVNKANGNPGEYGGGGGGAGGNGLVSGTTSSYRGGRGGNGIVIIEW